METSATPYTIIRYPCIESTNSIAYDLGIEGADNGTVIVAEQQTGGRGRQSRKFTSPRGGLYMSAILRPRLSVGKLSLITLAAGVACAEAVESFSQVSVQLKWPNDLYSSGKKIGGILAEAGPYSQKTGKVPFVVVGIGLNVNTPQKSFPEPLQDLATSLYCLTGQYYLIDLLLHSVIESLLKNVFQLAENAEFVLDKWQQRDFLLGKQLCWQDPQGWIVRGMGKGILPDGRYRLTTGNGDEYPVLAGDIVITEVNGQYIK